MGSERLPGANAHRVPATASRCNDVGRVGAEDECVAVSVGEVLRLGGRLVDVVTAKDGVR